MDKEFSADLLTLFDEDGNEFVFEILDSIEKDDRLFYALFPVYDSPEEQIESDGEYYIFESIEEDGEEMLNELEDEALLDVLAEEFESRFEDLYELSDDEVNE